MTDIKKTLRIIVPLVGILLLLWRFSLAPADLRFELFDIALQIWVFAPYIVYYVLTTKVNDNSYLIVGGALLIILDVLTHISIFLFPGSSTDALVFLFTPIYFSISIFVGFGLVKLFRKIFKKK